MSDEQTMNDFEHRRSILLETASEIAELQHKQKVNLAVMRAILMRHVRTQRELFGPLCEADDLPAEIKPDGDILESVYVSDGVVTAGFGYSFRSEWNQYDIVIPLRYLESGGDEVMRKEAATLAAKRNAEQASANARQEAYERAELARLQTKFGAPQ